MSSQRLRGGNPSFGPGEAEGMVRELRDLLRTEAALRERSETEGAALARARATSLLDELACRLELRFERHARSYFAEAPGLVDEAVAEMFAELCRRARDISKANGLMERRFNLVVKSLIVDAVRRVRIHNGLTKKGGPDTNGYHLISLEAATERAENAAPGERVARPLEIADPRGAEEHDRLAEREIEQVALARLELLPARQRLVVKCRLFKELTWAEVASRANVSVKTAQTDLEQAIATLRALDAQTEGRGAK